MDTRFPLCLGVHAPGPPIFTVHALGVATPGNLVPSSCLDGLNKLMPHSYINPVCDLMPVCRLSPCPRQALLCVALAN